MPRNVDARLIGQCQQGDREGFRALFEAYRDRVYTLAAYFSGDEATAKDVTQEVFVKLFQRIGDFRGNSLFDTWLYRLVMNTCMDERRRSRRFVPLQLLTGVNQMTRESHEQDRMRAEIAGLVQAAVKRLTPKLRLPVVLRYVEELSYEEIAAVLGCSQGTVASRLNRAHRILGRELRHLVAPGATGR